MSAEQFIKLDRKSLYQEIWEISASSVAKKYNIPYGDLLRICKEIGIPVPPSGYWVKLSFGKSVEKAVLPESEINEIILPINVLPQRKREPKISESIHAVM